MNETSRMLPTLRQYRPQDLGQILDLWQHEDPALHADGLSVDQTVDLLGSEDGVTVIAEIDERVVGVALSVVSTVIGWIYRISVGRDQDRSEDVARRLLEEVEVKLAEKGARRLATPAATDGLLRKALEARGYEATSLELMHRDVSTAVATPAALAELGGRMIDPDL